MRTHAPNGGVARPVTAASATNAAGGALAGNRPAPVSATAVIAAPDTSTVVCPQRSTRPPSSGADAALASAYAALTTPASANDPLSRWA
ncbi:MAG: hypothetical protein JO304_07825 [Solirubrobacterales bacterium]|nr:hypothetical protein [Solirubrobacterales bacterium]